MNLKNLSIYSNLVRVSDESKKRCRDKFPIKRIGKLIKSATSILDLVPVEKVITQCIHNSDNSDLRNVLLYFIRENCTDMKIIKELQNFE